MCLCPSCFPSGTPTEIDLEIDEESAWDIELADKSEPSAFTSSSSRLEEEPSFTSTAKALFRLYKCCIRLHAIEVEATCKLFLDYPLRPPLFSIIGVREVQAQPAGGKTKAGVKAGKPIEAVNGTIVMEQQVGLGWCSWMRPTISLYPYQHTRLTSPS